MKSLIDYLPEKKEDQWLVIDTVESVWSDILRERFNQIDKWDRKFLVWDSTLDRKNTVLGEEVGEVANAILEDDVLNLRNELIQVAAVCVAWIETLDNPPSLDSE